MARCGAPARREERNMTGQKRRLNDPWKSKVGVEFSGLERTSDVLVAAGICVTFAILAMVIAFLAVG